VLFSRLATLGCELSRTPRDGSLGALILRFQLAGTCVSDVVCDPSVLEVLDVGELIARPTCVASVRLCLRRTRGLVEREHLGSGWSVFAAGEPFEVRGQESARVTRGDRGVIDCSLLRSLKLRVICGPG
jgi:hypothetical protein